jgi:hypothetical protein
MSRKQENSIELSTAHLRCESCGDAARTVAMELAVDLTRTGLAGSRSELDSQSAVPISYCLQITSCLKKRLIEAIPPEKLESGPSQGFVPFRILIPTGLRESLEKKGVDFAALVRDIHVEYPHAEKREEQVLYVGLRALLKDYEENKNE